MERIKQHSKYSLLDSIIGQNFSFALYRPPHSKDIYLDIQSEGNPETYSDIASLNNKSGFVIAPFNISPIQRLVLIKPNISLIGEENVLNFLSQQNKNPEIIFTNSDENKLDNYADYQKIYHKFHEALENKLFRKLVLSRTCDVNKDRNFSIGKTFAKACQKYPDNFIFLIKTPQTGVWFGCSPETLVSGNGTQWQTVALAGTQETSKNVSDVIWDNKNSQEQQIVADYINNQLAKFGIIPSVGNTKTIRSGNIVHLKSEFNFSLADASAIGSLLELLHPSPAVCGFPKKEAFDFISENEGYNRKYYSGFVGRLAPQGETNLYVNLRCMQVFNDKLRLFAGGGILPSSQPEQEWNETESKLKTILSIIKD